MNDRVNDNDNTDLESWDDEQEAHAEAIREMVLDYLDEHDVDEGTAVFGLIEIALSIAMSGYVMSTEKPSAGGLQMELDRLSKDVNDLVREAKRGAKQFVEETLAALEESEEGEGGNA
ncbi:MAG: hypothetical protein LWW93_16630 [Hyphomicrobiales bacterium]|nr:hypothetical protein [Hyphomicrobiales bacterium]